MSVDDDEKHEMLLKKISMCVLIAATTEFFSLFYFTSFKPPHESVCGSAAIFRQFILSCGHFRNIFFCLWDFFSVCCFIANFTLLCAVPCCYILSADIKASRMDIIKWMESNNHVWAAQRKLQWVCTKETSILFFSGAARTMTYHVSLCDLYLMMCGWFGEE